MWDGNVKVVIPTRQGFQAGCVVTAHAGVEAKAGRLALSLRSSLAGLGRNSA